MFATDVRAGLPAILTNSVGQGAPWLDGNRMVAAVDGEGDVRFVIHISSQPSA
jgi:hypothetical protein